MTSPPYWGLRDYGVAGQIGLEAAYGDYVDTMVEVFREVRCVLRSDGTLWLNLGDSYATGAGRVGNAPGGGEQGERWRGGHEGKHGQTWFRRPELGATSQFSDRKVAGIGPMTQPNRMPQVGLKSKDLVGMPWRIAFALQADGWWLRQDIIWHKPNPMPESIGDRCTKSHEYLFLLSKSERYHYDAAAIKEPASYNPDDTKFPDGWDTGPGGHGSFHRQGREKGRASGNKSHKYVTEHETGDSEEHRTKAGLMKIADTAYPTRNKRSVWTVATQAFSEAHFATFPPALIEPCILAGCPAGGMVLDPFGGAGTTGLVADRLGRNAVLIELNAEYAAMAERRIRTDAGMLADIITP